MNTVFNKMVSLVLYLALSILTTNKVFANECAAISFAPEIINDKEYVVVVRADNGVSVMDLRKYRDIVEGEYRYTLSAGLHNLILDIWLKKDFSRIYRTWRGTFAVKPDYVNPKPELTKVIKVSVTADQFLQFSLSAPTINANFELTNQSSVKCNENKNNLISSQLILDDEVIAKNLQLPEVLEYRLARLMADIADDTIKKDDQAKTSLIANIAPLEVDTAFGIVLDDDNTRIKVLAVLPNSFAYNLGLASGDLIITLGGKPIEFKRLSTDDIVLEYLQSVLSNEVITMVVVRNNKSIQLSQNYIPLAFPDANYQIYNKSTEAKGTIKKAMIINGYTLPETLDYQYKQLRLAINGYIQGIKNSDGMITLDRKASLDKNFGIDVAIIPNSKSGGFTISAIEWNSSAAKLGLIKNDVMLAVNNQPLTNLAIKELSSLLNNLTVGQGYSIKVNRSNQVKVLNGVYQPRELPAFTLGITLVSSKSIEANLAFMKRMNMFSLSLEHPTRIRTSTENSDWRYKKNPAGQISWLTLGPAKKVRRGYTDNQGNVHSH